jgi:hypothetical protein
MIKISVGKARLAGATCLKNPGTISAGTNSM